ncbi:hypothetical protein RJ640_029738 [Escallonia rubra]|uniref:Reverse transcriptase Ty1/copia-type domain-containing protein n=1 Tax=Escallonia rubra TaxID=112253 RepID=A0AA88UAB7_9ASTE|nr:hypothetical protein RJ640_029738 [Escallonia rubra]
MSMMGELTFFLGLQIKQSKDEIFINQAKYTKELLKRFDMEASNAFDTPMSSSLKLDKDEKGKDVDIKRYRGLSTVDNRVANMAKDWKHVVHTFFTRSHGAVTSDAKVDTLKDYLIPDYIFGTE